MDEDQQDGAHPRTIRRPRTTVDIDPATQTGVFRACEGLVVEMGKHGTSSDTETNTTIDNDSAPDHGHDQDSRQNRYPRTRTFARPDATDTRDPPCGRGGARHLCVQHGHTFEDVNWISAPWARPAPLAERANWWRRGRTKPRDSPAKHGPAASSAGSAREAAGARWGGRGAGSRTRHLCRANRR
ncbi:putative ATP-grasp-modified RiPP [Streptomyces sp. NBC_00233]|nr:putative ATP-grasp-modified RiPP [Streptomyces sp. NBC_00233]